MSIPPDGPLQGIRDFGMQPIGALPFSVYPNSENITPPVDKEKLRVVEPSTRASVNMDVLRDWQAQKDYWDNIVKDRRIREYLNQQTLMDRPRDGNINVNA